MLRLEIIIENFWWDTFEMHMTEKLEKQDLEMLIQICDDWGFEYGCKNKSWEVEDMKKKLQKIVRYL